MDGKIYRGRTVLSGLALVCCLTSLVYMPIFSEFKDTWHIWLSGSTIKFAKHWLHTNPASTLFVMTELPPSIEFPDVKSQMIYCSYPPGAVLPIYAFALASGISPDIVMVRIWNHLIKFGVALCIVGFVWNSLRTFSREAAFFGAFVGGLFYLLSSNASLYHYSSYFSDQAVLFPVAALLYYESGNRKKKWLPIMILMLTWGALTDPLIYFVGGAIAILYWIRGAKEKSFWRHVGISMYILIPLVIGLTLFVYQLWYYDSFSEIIDKFKYRTQGYPNHSYFSFFNTMLHFRQFEYDLTSVLPCIVTVIVVLRPLSAKDILKTIQASSTNKGALVAFTGAVLAHTFLFKSHSGIHSFSLMKYIVLLALFTGIASGWLITHHGIIYRICYLLTIGILVLGFSLQTIDIYLTRTVPDLELAKVVKMDSDYNTIAISPVYEIPENPPVLLSISEKILHHVTSGKPLGENILSLDPEKYKLVYIVPEGYFSENNLRTIANDFPKIEVRKYATREMDNLVELKTPPGIDIRSFIEYLGKAKRAEHNTM